MNINPNRNNVNFIGVKNPEQVRKIINDIIVEACDLACWVYVCKFIEGLSLEQIVEQNRSAEQFIAALFSMFDKYIDIPDNDSNNIRPS